MPRSRSGLLAALALTPALLHAAPDDFETSAVGTSPGFSTGWSVTGGVTV